MTRGANGRRRAVALALVAALAASLGAGSASAAGPKRCNGELRLCDRTFDRVVLATTHNAMSAAALGWSIPNQQLGIPEQLRRGVHGLLLDTYYAHRASDGAVVNDPTRTADSQIFLCHVSCRLGATPLISVLRAMRAHLRAHPRNVLAVINEDHVAPEDFAADVRRSGLLRHVYRGRPGPWPTLRRMIERRRQVVMLAENDAAGVSWYHRAYDGILQETPYTWSRPELLTDPAGWRNSCRPNRGGTTGSLFLMNHWSPPLAPTPATSAVVNAADTLVGRAKTCAFLRGRMPTFVAVDMFPNGGLLEAVRRLNAAVR